MALQMLRASCSSALRCASAAVSKRMFTSAEGSDQAQFDSILEDLRSAPLGTSQNTSDSDMPTSRSSADASSQPTSIDPEHPEDAEPHMRLIDRKFGYAVLGGIDPSDTSQWNLSTPKVNPLRDFSPGETYKPEDLDPFFQKRRQLQQVGPARARPPINNSAVYKQADYKDPDFLEQFVSPAGRLLPRRATRLKPAVHKHVMRQIKIARVMALMPHEARIGDDQRKRLRQFEQLQSKSRVQEALGGSEPAAPASEQPPVV